MVPTQMPSASSTDARTLMAEMKRQLQHYRAEHLQLEASMRWRLERELEASRVEHADLVARMTSSIATLEHATVPGMASSSLATLELAAATPTGAAVPSDQAPSSQPAHQAAVLSHSRPTAMPATADAILPVDWTPQLPIFCLLPDDLLERIAMELQSGVVWQTCAFLRHRRLNSIEALVLSSCKLQILEVPTGGSRDALVLRLGHQLNAGRAIMRQLRSAVGEVAAAEAPSEVCALTRYSDPWKAPFNAIDLISTGDDVHGLGLGQLSPDIQLYFADALPALLRDERLPASSCVNGDGIKQEFLESLRDHIYRFLVNQAKPHRVGLLIQAAEEVIDSNLSVLIQALIQAAEVIDSCIEQAALANRHGVHCSAQGEARMRLLKKFVRNNGYLLSERQQKACSRIINSPTISERVRNSAVALFEENAKAQGGGRQTTAIAKAHHPFAIKGLEDAPRTRPFAPDYYLASAGIVIGFAGCGLIIWGSLAVAVINGYRVVIG